jgi:hypothetical protein
MTTEAGHDHIHVIEPKIILPDSLHGFITDARRNTWASENPPIEVPGRFGLNRYEYHEPGSNLFYEDEFRADPEIPGVVSGTETAKILGRRRRILVTYGYSGETTQRGIEIGEDVVFKQLQYFLREYADKARFGTTLDVEHRDQGKWTYLAFGITNRNTWNDRELLRYEGETVHIFNGTGALFYPHPTNQ